MTEETVETVVIELRDGPVDGRRVLVTAGISGVAVPARDAEGFIGEVLYRPTGQFAEPGVEIFRPQIGKGH